MIYSIVLLHIASSIFLEEYIYSKSMTERTCAARGHLCLSYGDVFLIRRFVGLVLTCFLFARSQCGPRDTSFATEREREREREGEMECILRKFVFVSSPIQSV